MLKIKVLGIGKDKDRWVSDACDHYVKLISRWAKVELDYVPSPKASASLTPDQIRAAESALLAERCGSGYTVALTASARQVDSHGFAELVQKWQTVSGGMVTFVVGGPHGLTPDFVKGASMALSLSPLTFSHQIVRLVLLEQLYRGFSILQGTSYHK